MEAKTKIDKEVVRLSRKLPRISPVQVRWMEEKVHDHYCILYSKRKIDNMECLECRNKWTHDTPLLVAIDGEVVCPHCGRKLKLRADRCHCFNDRIYVGMVTVKEDYQVIRMFMIRKFYTLKSLPKQIISEIYQVWMRTGEVDHVMSVPINGLSAYGDQWVYGRDMEIRSNANHWRYSINPYATYPRMKVLPVLRRNGFTGDLHDINPRELLNGLIHNPRVETLFKAGQYNLLSYLLDNNIDIEKRWPYYKICMRNHYIIKDAQMWHDHVCLLEDEHEKMVDRDPHALCNAKYLCPADLMAAHQVYIDRQNVRLERQRVERKRLDGMSVEDLIKEFDKKYLKDKQAFLDLEFSTPDGLKAKVLPDVNAFLEEGKAMHHCVFTGRYFAKKDTLVLSVTKEDQRVETVDVELKGFTINQAYGACNNVTPLHKDVLNLVNSHMDEIRKRARKARKEQAQEVQTQCV